MTSFCSSSFIEGETVHYKHLAVKDQHSSQEWWRVPVIPATQETGKRIRLSEADPLGQNHKMLFKK
jgi:hypothetical protein